MTWSKRNLCNFYGDMFQFELSTAVVINTIGVFEVVPDMSAGLNRGFVFQNTQELKVVKAGKYKVDWSISFQDGNNQTWEGAIFINGTKVDSSTAVRFLGAVDTGNFGSHSIIDVEVDDIIDLRMANLTSTSNAVIDSAAISIIRVDN